MVPSELWAIVVLPLAKVLVALAATPMVFVPLYFVPFTVTLQSLEAVELIRPEEPAISWSVQLTVVVLFATLWLACDQLNLSVFHEVTATDFEPLVAISATYLYK